MTAGEIDTLIGGGGGSFPLGFSAPMTAMGATLRASRLNNLIGDYAAPEVDVPVSAAALFDEDQMLSNTLGAQEAAKGRRVWEPIKPFADRRTEVAVSRLIDAMTTFGVDPVMDGFGGVHDGIDRSGSPELGFDGGMRRTHPISSNIAAMIE